MKDHPLTPMTDSSLVRLLEPQVTTPVGLVDWSTVTQGAQAITAELAELETRGFAHVVIDAIANEDLLQIATACRHLPLLTGGSALAMPLPEPGANRNVGETAGGSANPRPGPGTVILSGSASEMSNTQVAAYRAGGAPALRLDPRALANTGSAPARRWLADQDLTLAPLVYSTAEPKEVRAVQRDLGQERAAALVEKALADCARVAVAEGARRLIVAGGETSGAVTRALAVSRLELGPEIVIGVPWCYFVHDEDTYAIALKSGNFGTETFFSDALEVLERE